MEKRDIEDTIPPRATLKTSTTGSQRESERILRNRHEPPLAKKKQWWKLLLGVIIPALVLVLIFLMLPIYSQYKSMTKIMDQLVATRYQVLRVSPLEIKIGTDINAIHLLDRLKSDHYRRSHDQKLSPGEYRITGNTLSIRTRGQARVSSSSYLLTLDSSLVHTIMNLEQGKQVPSFFLDSCILTYFVDSVWEIREPLTFDAFPQQMINSLLATEDQDFFQHPGLNFKALMRATIANYRAGAIVQGGSTITLQIIKVLLRQNERTLKRKFREAILALAIEALYSKKEILSVYLNNIYLGQIGPYEIRGVAAAARIFFHKDLTQLSEEEYVILAGIVRSPNRLSPLRNPERAKKRAEIVQTQLHREEAQIQASYSQTPQGLLPQQPLQFDRDSYAYALARIDKELSINNLKPCSPMDFLTVETSIDPWMQAAAVQALQKGLTEKSPELQGAVVVMDPKTGAVRAAAGGKDFRDSNFNRVFQARRQLGSLVKPFVYLSAMGGNGIFSTMSQAELVDDEPLTVYIYGKKWTPSNYDHKYEGLITMRRALAYSRNIPAVRVGLAVGTENLVSLFNQTSLCPGAENVPALILGACESTPAQVAAAYSGIANGGETVTPTVIVGTYKNGYTVWTPTRTMPFFSPATVYVVADMMRAVFSEGTARQARPFGFSKVAAGKTGTTSGLKDAWFAGFSHSLVSVVWVGRDDNRKTGYTGAQVALPIWADTMNSLIGKSLPEPTEPPADVVFANVDRKTGKIATDDCPNPIAMAFVVGTEPTEQCQAHLSAFASLRKKILQTARDTVSPPATSAENNQTKSWMGTVQNRTFAWFKKR